MAKSNSKRKTRSDKFPLTLHPTGQYCKKIKGKLYYFGSAKKKALENYLEQAILHIGKGSKLKTEKGVGFYTFRRTAATLAARSGDPFAVQKLFFYSKTYNPRWFLTFGNRRV